MIFTPYRIPQYSQSTRALVDSFEEGCRRVADVVWNQAVPRWMDAWTASRKLCNIITDMMMVISYEVVNKDPLLVLS